MMLTSILILFLPKYYKEFVAKNNISGRVNLGPLDFSKRSKLKKYKLNLSLEYIFLAALTICCEYQKMRI